MRILSQINVKEKGEKIYRQIMKKRKKEKNLERTCFAKEKGMMIRPRLKGKQLLGIVSLLLLIGKTVTLSKQLLILLKGL